MEFSVVKMKCWECGTVFYSGQEEEDWEKCPMTFCEDGYGYEEDEIMYTINVDKMTGEVTVEKQSASPDVIKIK